MFNKEDFPHISKAVLEEAAKPLNKKYLDVLIGNQILGLQPVCEIGFGCQDCARGHCLYRSKFGSGYVPLGSFGKDQPVVTVLKHVALTKISPPIQGLFFQGEALGVSPAERCLYCKVRRPSAGSVAARLLYSPHRRKRNIISSRSIVCSMMSLATYKPNIHSRRTLEC